MLLRSMEGENETIVTTLVNHYESDVANGDAPPMLPWFLEHDQPSSSEDLCCTLSRLMKVFSTIENNEDRIPLSSVISPAGHSPNAFDVSRSFHFAAVLSALGVCEELTDEKECALLESYASQLQSVGAWEWAVYVALCRLSESPLSRNMIARKKRMAFEIVHRYYTVEEDEDLKKCRSFLEKEVGIPSAWFEMALSTSAIQRFDVRSFVSHSVSFSRQQALQVYEEAILPDDLFNGGKENYRGIINFLDAMNNDNSDFSTLRGAVYNYLQLMKGVANFVNEDTTQTDSVDLSYQNLLERARSILRCVIKLQEQTSSWKLFDGLPLVPESATLTELSSSLSLLMARLNDIGVGQIVFQGNSDAMTIKDVGHPAFAFACTNDDFVFNQLNSKTALRDKYKMVDLNVAGTSDTVYRPQRL
jgi:hypothetical protein